MRVKKKKDERDNLQRQKSCMSAEKGVRVWKKRVKREGKKTISKTGEKSRHGAGFTEKKKNATLQF